ncbi:myosin light chain kinase A-like isoform X2 [Bolinopsis microptera]|uniref:myosin light chain kinase A-like isoform X2 n=1 Tax=Bolinopsis microptera TaxID=2820187 RepID=UPI003078C1BF
MVDYFFASSLKTSLEDTYNVGEPCSSGPLSVVHGAENKHTKSSYVVKKIAKNSYLQGNDLSSAEEMARTISRVRHPNICPVTDIYEDRENVYVIMESIPGGELFTRLANVESYSEYHAAAIIRDVLSAVQYLHMEDIIHANIKPENVLSGNSKEYAPTVLADFYMSSLMSHGVLMNGVCGNPSYVAPEILRGFPPSRESDVWSIGVLTYVLLSGLEPFPSPNQGDAGTYSNVVRCDFEFIKPFFNKVSKNAQDFISKLVTLVPGERLTVAEALEHPWCKGDAAKMEPMVGVGKRLSDMLLKKRETGSLQIGRVLARYDTKTPLEEVETKFDHPEEVEKEITTDEIDFSDPEALAKALNMSTNDMS